MKAIMRKPRLADQPRLARSDGGCHDHDASSLSLLRAGAYLQNVDSRIGLLLSYPRGQFYTLSNLGHGSSAPFRIACWRFKCSRIC